MRIIIVGAGEVGSYLCETLSQYAHDVTVIERSEEKAMKLRQEFDVRVLQESGSSARTLIKAGVKKCDYFLAMARNDETNLVSSSLARALGARNTFTRIHDQTFRDNSIINYQNHFGIDYLINPERLAAVELAKAIRNPSRVAVEDFARGAIEVQLVEVTRRSKAIGKTLAELKLDNRMRIGMVQRGDRTMVADARTVLEADDSITVFGHPDALFETRSIFDPHAGHGDRLRVVIMGGGEMTVSLVRLLSNPRFKIRIIENDPARCRKLADRFPEATLIHGTGTSLKLLEEEQIGSTDFFVACTKTDEDNVMTCLQASKLGARHVMLAINRTDYADVLEEMKIAMGVELAVSPRVATANQILRYISREPYIDLGSLPGDVGKIIEITVKSDSPSAGKKLREINWPTGCVAVALLHKSEAKTPGADDIIEAGDHIVVIVQQERIKDLLKLTV
jgi:trk system potassium uptake protein TrkA